MGEKVPTAAETLSTGHSTFWLNERLSKFKTAGF